jgi:predicted acyl esterase
VPRFIAAPKTERTIAMTNSRLRCRVAELCATIFIQLTGLSLCFVQADQQTSMVSMSDGIKLATDVYLPAQGAAPYPVVLIRTPYDKNSLKGGAGNMCALGYAVVVQDMRGRFSSEGHHAIIFGNEGLGGANKDGHDTIKWIAEQPWCNGKIATWGGSALGIAQNMAAPGAPTELKGQVVQVAFSNYYGQAAYQGGVWRKELLEGWLKATKMEDGNLSTFLGHPYYDEFWKSLNAEQHAPLVNAPGVFSGGWYDIFLQGTINSFVTIQDRGGPEARGHCVLIIAPVAHGAFKELVYPTNIVSAAPVNPMAPMGHFAAWLKGEPSNISELKPVHYFVMGDPIDQLAPGNFWRSADSWPPPAKVTPFYFCSNHELCRSAPTDTQTLSYKYDPNDPVPTVGGQNLNIEKGPMDQTKVEGRPDVLLFTSDPLEQPIEVSGRIGAKLWISSDCPDTDFTVKLCDVYPDGRSMLVTDGIRRASLRNGFETPEFLESGMVVEVNVDLWSTSLIFNKGHRIRVAVSSSNAPRFEPNANSGDPHPVGKTRIATNTLYVSQEHPSAILLPIYNGP